MRIEDLQIGDIVFDSNKIPVVFNGMGCEGRMGSTDRYCELIDKRRSQVYNEHFTKLSPIPLTEEILESNGWRVEEHSLDGDSWYYQKGSHLYIAVQKEEGTNIGFVTEWIFDDAYTVCYCRYVSDLQHALRLCGYHEIANNIQLWQTK